MKHIVIKNRDGTISGYSSGICMKTMEDGKWEQVERTEDEELHDLCRCIISDIEDKCFKRHLELVVGASYPKWSKIKLRVDLEHGGMGEIELNRSDTGYS